MFSLTAIALQRSAALKIDWTKLGSQLGLKGQTAAALSSFKKRNDDARRKLQQLSELPQTVDFAHYRSTLKNQSVIDEIEQAMKTFKPVTYDVQKQIKAIDAFEVQAVKNAEETKSLVSKELVDLEKTLTNIREARPLEDLTIVCVVMAARAETSIDTCFRTILPMLVTISTRLPLSTLPRVAGMFPDTRQVQTQSASTRKDLTQFTGEIR